MLPDFPVLKEEIQKIIVAKLRHTADTGDPVLSQIKHFTQHEGREMRYEQHGGGTVQEGAEEVGVRFEVLLSDVPTMVGYKLNAKLQEIARELTSQQARLFFKKMDEICEKAGTAINSGGKPISAETILEMLSAAETDFDRDGKPTSTFIVHPDMVPSLKKVAEEIENDPDLKRRNSEILERQREAWAARESNRKLVD